MDSCNGAQTPLRVLIKLCQLRHATRSDPLGAEWCERKFIGRLRREQDARHAADALSFGAPPGQTATAFLGALKEECSACGECELARK